MSKRLSEEQLCENRKVYNATPFCRYNNAECGAEIRELGWQITFNQFKYFLSEACFVTGCSDKVTGLDRIDNAIGYVFSNVRPSCHRHNCMKNDMSDEEFIKKCIEVANWATNLKIGV